MSEIIGRGVVEVSADATKLNAGIEQAKATIKSLGVATADVTKAGSASIDRYVKSLATQAATLGKSSRETELYKLALRGATDEQLKTADSSLKMIAAQEKQDAVRARLKTGLIAMAAVAAVAAGAWAQMIGSSIDAADALNDLSKKTGIGVEDLSGLGLAAKQSGTDLEGLADSINKLSKNIGKDPEKYKALGITAKEPLEAFKQLADIFVAIEDPQLRAALGAEALGKSWSSAAPVLAEGAAGITEMVDKGKRLSGVTQEMAEGADKLNDKMAELKAITNGLGNKIAAEMIPGLTEVAGAVAKAYEETGKLQALWVAMGAAAAFTFTDHFKTDSQKIKDLNRDIRDLNKDMAVLLDPQSKAGKYFTRNRIAEITADIKTAQDKIAALQATPASALTSKAGAGRGKINPELTDKVKTFVGADPADAAKLRDTAAQEARARVQADLATIKANAAQVADAYAGGEKTIEALRAAALIDEAAYYDSKKLFLTLNAGAQETALINEIARLQKEKLAGKDRIENERAITEARAKLAKVQAGVVVDTNVLDIQRQAALDKITQSYNDARIAAQAYIDTVKAQNARELSGLGQGNKRRANDQGISAIEDKQTTQRQALERDLRNNQITRQQYDDYLQIITETYAQEIDLYNQRSRAIDSAQGDWLMGVSEAMANYLDESRNVAAQSEAAWTNAAKGMEDALVNLAMTGKLNFSQLANSIISDLIRIEARKATSSLFSSLFSLFLPAAGVAAGPEQLSGPGMPGRAIGGPVSAGGLYAINETGRPEILSMGGRDYLMTGGSGGTVKPQAASTGSHAVTINIGAGVTRTELAALVPELKKQIRAELMYSMRRPGFNATA